MNKRRIWKKKLPKTSTNFLERIYFKEVGELVVLSPRAEQELASSFIQTEGEENLKIRNDMVKGNLRYVVALAMTYNGRGIPLLDLIQAGNEALILTANKMVPGKARLSYFAREAIKGNMTDLFNGKGVVDIPGDSFTLHNKYMKTKEELEHRLGRQASFEEITNNIGLTETEGDRAICAGCRTVSLHSRKFDEDNPENEDGLSDFVDKRVNLVSSTYNSERRITIEKSLKCLTNRERKVILRYYGLFGNERQTLNDIAETLGVTRSAVGQIRDKALQKLAHPKRAKFLRPFLEELTEREIS